jgi:hypothetical protein
LLVVGGNARRFWPTIAIVVVVAVAGFLVWVVWRSPHRSDLSVFGAFAAAVVAVLIPVIGYFAKIRQPADPDAWTLDHVADLLAEMVQEQWIRAARERRLHPDPIPVRWQRSSGPVTGPVCTATGSKEFRPLPGLPSVGAERLRHGGLQDLHAVYGGLGSGRLLVVGAPGSGKTGAAVLLILAALRHREQLPEEDRCLVPVPVLFTLHGWDPRVQQVDDWLAGRLRQAYPLLSGKGGAAAAADLVRRGRVAVILDGLDEIPCGLRPVALRALSDQAAFRLVVLSRSAEMAAAAIEGFLHGAVALELQDVCSRAAAGYLTNVQRHPPPSGWGDLTGRLRRAPGSPLARALGSPLALTLLRDTYRDGENARGFLDFCDAVGDGLSREDVEDHLLDRVLPAAYSPRPGEPPPRYELQVAQRALSYVATQMNQDRARDLAWWRIPAWTPGAGRMIAGGLMAGLGFGLLAGLGFGLVADLRWGAWQGLEYGLGFGLAFGLVAGLVIGLGGRGGGYPARRAPLRWRRLFSGRAVTGLLSGVGLGLMAGLLFGLASGIDPGPVPGPGGLGTALTWGLKRGLPIGLGFGLLVGLLAWLVVGLGRRDDGYPARRARWRSRQPFSSSSSMTGLLTGLIGALVIGTLGGTQVGPVYGLLAGLVSGLGIGLIFGLGAELTVGFSRPEPTDASPFTPLLSWRSDQASRLAGGLAAGLVGGLTAGLGFGILRAAEGNSGTSLLDGLFLGLGLGLVSGLIFALAYSPTLPASLAFAQLASRQHTPLRLMRFLEDARQRQVLRTVGPIYQFRHARLQDRLAAQAATTMSGVPAEPAVTADQPANVGDPPH